MGRSVVRHSGLATVLFTYKDFYYPGEPVEMFLYTVNESPRPVSLIFPTTQRYDFIVSGPWGEVWRWSVDRFFSQGDYEITPTVPQVVETVILQPGENLVYREIWNQRGSGGWYVPPGTYLIFGWNTFNGSQYLPRPYVYITIGRPWYY